MSTDTIKKETIQFPNDNNATLVLSAGKNKVEDVVAALELPAYSAGDSVFVRFIMTGFKVAQKNGYHLSYELFVTRPDGKPYLDRPDAAELASESFYPAQYLPGDFALTTSRDSPKGIYIILLRVRDKIGNSSKEFRFPFTIE